MAKKGGHIKVDSTMKARIRATRLTPSAPIGVQQAYKKVKPKKDSLQLKADSLQRENDSLKRIVIELKAKLKEK